MRAFLLPALSLAFLGTTANTPTVGQDKSVAQPKGLEKIKKNFGPKSVEILTDAERVETFRLQPDMVRKAAPDTVGPNAKQWVIKTTGKEQGKEFAAKIRAVLLDENTFSLNWETEITRADLAFRLWKEKESVTVVVDFESGIAVIVSRNAEGREIKASASIFMNNSKNEYDKKGVAFARMKAVAVEAFPEDEKLKAVKQPKEPEEEVFPPIGDKVPEALLTILEKGESFELLSLDPKPEKKVEGTFHGYRVLGTTTVKDADTRKKLIAALKKGVEDNTGAAAGCFNPRHGIRVTHEKKTTEFVICFECLFVQVYTDGKLEQKGLRTTSRPAATFNSVLKDAKVPLPEK